MTHTTTRPSTAATRGTSAVALHRDGTVTIWSCTSRERWERGVPGPHSDHWAEMDSDARELVARHVGGAE